MHRQSPRRAFTLIELLVVMAIIAVLAAIVLAMTPIMKRRSQITQSLNNLRTIGSAFQLYAGEHDFDLPSRVVNGDKWPRLLYDYIGQDARVYADPGDKQNYLITKKDPLSNSPNNTSYIMNGFNDVGALEDEAAVVRLNNIDRPTQTLLAAAQTTGNFYLDLKDGDQDKVLNKTLYGDGSTYLFCDGSVRLLSLKEYNDDLWLVHKVEVQPGG